MEAAESASKQEIGRELLVGVLLHTEVKWIIAGNKEKHIAARLAKSVFHTYKCDGLCLRNFLSINGFYDKNVFFIFFTSLMSEQP